MNWSRVRTENLSLLHGSEWVKPSDDTLFSLGSKGSENSTGRQKKRKKKRPGSGLRRKSRPIQNAVNLAQSIAGCTCGKSLGFTGQHKKACPLRKPESSPEAQVNANWVCPECHAALAGAKVPQPVALEILLRHQRISHQRSSGQSTVRTEIGSSGTPSSELSRGL